ncbi:ABC transporter permease family protein [Methanofollis fontis]|nr:ABC transporter permease [Methanofollis fontis]
MTAVLLVALLLASGFAAQSGVHLQDGIYTAITDDQAVAAIIAENTVFSVTLADPRQIGGTDAYDLIVVGGEAHAGPTAKGRAALSAFATTYRHYTGAVYTGESDLFAAYPLWIDTVEVESRLDFDATESGEIISAVQRGDTVRPSGPVEEVPTPSATLAVTAEDLREDLAAAPADSGTVTRYLGMFSDGPDLGEFKTPSQLSPPLPFDSLIYVFVFIFPLYFTSQFAMMSVANERTDRRGEILLSTPAGPLTIICGKMLPYFLLMILISSAIVLVSGGSFVVLLPLVPVILFFLAAALLIGMTARSYRELSFLSIFFSTVMTSYLFFPSVFANVHVISLISPLTLIVLEFGGSGFSAADYLYATALFWLSTALILWLCTRNFNEERLFSQERLTSRLRSFIFSAMSRNHPFASLVAVNALSIPLVFMVQLMYLVLLFNLPLPWSLLLLILLAALTEEAAKSIGIIAVWRGIPGLFTWKNVVIAAAATGLGFLVGEKLLLFAMLSQVTGSVFGAVLFSGVGLLWMPFLLHSAGALIVGAALKVGGRGAYVPAILLAAAVHAAYNLILIGGAL